MQRAVEHDIATGLPDTVAHHLLDVTGAHVARAAVHAGLLALGRVHALGQDTQRSHSQRHLLWHLFGHIRRLARLCGHQAQHRWV